MSFFKKPLHGKIQGQRRRRRSHLHADHHSTSHTYVWEFIFIFSSRDDYAKEIKRFLLPSSHIVLHSHIQKTRSKIWIITVKIVYLHAWKYFSKLSQFVVVPTILFSHDTGLWSHHQSEFKGGEFFFLKMKLRVLWMDKSFWKFIFVNNALSYF